MPDFCIVINNDTLNEYADLYFEAHPKARKRPIDKPYHPSINTWMIMRRPEMNALKQKWKEFIIWLVGQYGYTGLKLQSYEMYIKVYMPTKRRCDPDNQVPKFIMDGLVESGMLEDDDGERLKKLSISTRHDKDNPRTEIEIWTLKGE